VGSRQWAANFRFAILDFGLEMQARTSKAVPRQFWICDFGFGSARRRLDDPVSNVQPFRDQAAGCRIVFASYRWTLGNYSLMIPRSIRVGSAFKAQSPHFPGWAFFVPNPPLQLVSPPATFGKPTSKPELRYPPTATREAHGPESLSWNLPNRGGNFCVLFEQTVQDVTC